MATTIPDPTISRPRSRFWTTFGPGMLWAAAAIGVSHLVQSTRAGADGGFSLAWVILVALALKYPFFEYGPRYAAATGESLVEGYARIGRWAVWVYVLITLSTALIVQGTVTLFTAFLVGYAFGFGGPIPILVGVTLGSCVLLLWLGRFPALDLAIKLILAALGITTLAAAALTLPRASDAVLTQWPAGPAGEAIGFAFLLALVGWMPSAIDISVWSSLWTLAKDRASGVRSSLAEALLDFRIGYIGTGVIAFAFLTLGATVMHASGRSFSPAGTAFSVELVDVYTATLGEWVRPMIVVAVVTTMVSTVLVVVDGFPRAIARSFAVLREGPDRRPPPSGEDRGYWLLVVLLAGLTVVTLTLFSGTMTSLVDFATIVSFMTAPVLGYLNLRAVTADHVPAAMRPSRVGLWYSWLGLGLMVAVALAFAVGRMQ